MSRTCEKCVHHDVCRKPLEYSADPETCWKYEERRPHGEWEFIGENLFKCTNCGYIADADYLRKWKVHTYDAEFPTACLKCGADMRKEGEEK